MPLMKCDPLVKDIIKDNIAAEKIKENKVVFASFANDFAHRFCWSTNALEGNTLSLEDTISLIEYDEVKSGHTYAEYHEAKNVYAAIKTMMLPLEKREINAEWLKKCNGMTLGTKGDYRTGDVYIGSIAEAVYYPPSAENVPGLMNQFLSEIELQYSSVSEFFEQLSLQHIKFERIHPFPDGNGRVGRMILNQQLINHGFLPISISPTGKYRQAFRRYNQNSDFSLLEYVICKSALESYSRLNELNDKYLRDRSNQRRIINKNNNER